MPQPWRCCAYQNFLINFNDTSFKHVICTCPKAPRIINGKPRSCAPLWWDLLELCIRTLHMKHMKRSLLFLLVVLALSCAARVCIKMFTPIQCDICQVLAIMGHRQAVGFGGCNPRRCAREPGARPAWRGAIKQAVSYHVGHGISEMHDPRFRPLDGDCLLCFAESPPSYARPGSWSATSSFSVLPCCRGAQVKCVKCDLAKVPLVTIHVGTPQACTAFGTMS